MTLRGSTVAYFFKDYIPEGAQLTIGGMSVLFYAGVFLSVGEISNMAGVAFAAPLSARIGKKNTFLFSMLVLAVLSVAFFFIPVNRIGFLLMLLLQVLICIRRTDLFFQFHGPEVRKCLRWSYGNVAACSFWISDSRRKHTDS